MTRTHWNPLRAWTLAIAFAFGAGTLALIPHEPTHAQAGRNLPDFADLAEAVGPAVVGIRTLEKTRTATGMPDNMDEEMREFFRRFFGQPAPGTPDQQPRAPRRQQRPQPRKNSRAAWARDSSSPPTAT